jgi:MFS family permease
MADVHVGFGPSSKVLLPATLIAGPVADTAGVRPMVAVSVVLAGVATVLLAAAPSVWWLAAGRLLQGVAMGTAGAPLTTALLAVEQYGDRRRASLQATALLTAAAGTGPLLSGALANGRPHLPAVCRSGRLVGCGRLCCPSPIARPAGSAWSPPKKPCSLGAGPTTNVLDARLERSLERD